MLFTELPPGERDEDVLQRRVTGSTAATAARSSPRCASSAGRRGADFVDGERPAARREAARRPSRRAVAASVRGLERRIGGELDHCCAAQRGDQLARACPARSPCRDRRWPRDRTAARPRPCSGWSAARCRRGREVRDDQSHSWRRDCGSSPVVGSSRNSSSGSPTSAQATARRCRCPPEMLVARVAFLAERDQLQHRVDGRGRAIERAEQRAALRHRQLLGEVGLLQRHAEALAQRVLVVAPATAEHVTSPAVGSSSPSRISMVVVLPAPLGPSRPKHSPTAHLADRARPPLRRRRSA